MLNVEADSEKEIQDMDFNMRDAQAEYKKLVKDCDQS